MTRTPWFAAAALAGLAASAFAASVSAADVKSGGLDPGVTTPHYGSWGFDLAGRDTSVKPGDDFFQYANGGFVDRLQIPADRTSYGNYVTLSVLSENRVHKILDDAAAGRGGDDPVLRQKLGAYYTAFMDEGRVNALGAAPLQADLAKVKAARSHDDIAALMGDKTLPTDSFFGAYVSPDAKDPLHYTVDMGTDGLGLPDKDYYLSEAFASKRAAYQVYVAKMLELSGWADPQGDAAAIVAMETRLAKASWDRVQRRDRDKTYNPVTPAALQAMAPGFDFKRFLASADLSSADKLVLSDNTAFAPKAKIFADTPVPVLQAWLAFNMADTMAPYLSAPFVDARFAFRNQVLQGQPQQAVRWKRAVESVNGALGEGVGKVYVAEYFPPEAKAQMLALVSNIKTVLSKRIDALDWMVPSTKAEAQKKLAAFTVKIAYPDKFRDYSALQVSSTDLYGDVKRSRTFEYEYRTRRLHQPVDRKEWGMTPQTVNAYYNPTQNEIVFPAAILQPPFFDPKADPAINYGGIGGVIGHEISHGFDDQGRKSNGLGVLTDWWTAADATAFKGKTDRLGKQYSEFTPIAALPNEHVNGQLTMGENIGDAGGVNFALDAYHESLHGKPAPVIDGLTGDQRVFLAWAQVWRGKTRDDALVQRLHTDPHSPESARVNGPVRNVDAWYEAFDVKPGDKLYLAPADRVKIW